MKKYIAYSLGLSAVFATSAHANLQIVATYSGFTAQQETAFNYVINEYESIFTDNIHVNIQVQATNQGLGGSSTNLVGIDNYAGVKAALKADATSAEDNSAVANMGGDPTNGGNFWYATAQAKALKLIPDDNNIDGVISINTLGGFQFTYDPLNRQVAGKFDFIGVAEHEMAEVMGRFALENANIGGTPNSYDPLDLFRFKGGNHSVSPNDTNVYFSIDGGTTSLLKYNGPGNGGDLADLLGNDPTDPYNAFTGPNQAHKLNNNDITQMDVIGWDVKSRQAVPEPTTMAILAGAAAIAARRRKNS